MLKSSESNWINYLIGQNNVGQCDEIFRRCPKKACIFGMFYWTKVTVFTLCGENFVRHCFVR